jgi:hypothetical protein
VIPAGVATPGETAAAAVINCNNVQTFKNTLAYGDKGVIFYDDKNSNPLEGNSGLRRKSSEKTKARKAGSYLFLEK